MENKTLLVVVDMQNDFINGVLGTEQARGIIPAMVNSVKQFPLRVFTLDTHEENYLQTQEGRKLPVPHCIAGTSGHALIDELSPYNTAPVKNVP